MEKANAKTIYRNTAFTGRNDECTNVVFQTTENGGPARSFSGQVAPCGQWVECNDEIPANMTYLGRCGSNRFFGYM